MIEEFTISLNTNVTLDVKNLMAYKRISNKSLKFLRDASEFTIFLIFTKLKRQATSEQMKKILEINPELLEFVI